MLVRLADGTATAIDYRETAPRAATRDMFLDRNGEYDPKKSRDSGLATGVPGTVAGLALALERYGSGRFKLFHPIPPAVAPRPGGLFVEDRLADLLPRAPPRAARFSPPGPI